MVHNCNTRNSGAFGVFNAPNAGQPAMIFVKQTGLKNAETAGRFSSVGRAHHS
jgi:hypothetical protein